MARMLLTAALLSAVFVGTAAAQTSATQPSETSQPATAQAPGGEPSQETLDALKALDCTIEKVVLCDGKGECRNSDTFGEVALPTKILTDPAHRIIAGVNNDGLPHISPIHLYSQTGKDLTAQGFDGEVSWMLLADREDDTMTFVASSDHAVLNGFGTCKDVDE